MTTNELPMSDRVGRYADIVAAGSTVIYDRQNRHAWVQSDSAQDLTELR